MKLKLLIILALLSLMLLAGCGNKLRGSEYWYEEGKRIGRQQGMSEGIEMAEKYGVRCSWETWTEDERYCLKIINGENKYLSFWIICKDHNNSKYEKIKEIVKE